RRRRGRGARDRARPARRRQRQPGGQMADPASGRLQPPASPGAGAPGRTGPARRQPTRRRRAAAVAGCVPDRDPGRRSHHPQCDRA
ncbi:hypothetical protein LTR94_035964, partial [Friedmanniomyces endolithicus]